MSWPTRFTARVRALFLRSRLERELEDELRFHLEMQAEDNVRAGMDPKEAHYAAMRSFGGAEQIKENYRDWRTFAAIETMVQDVRYALRATQQNPGFTTIAVLSLALGIGANTAIFSLIDALLLRSLPVPDPQRLVQVVVPQRTAPPFEVFSYPMVHALANHKEIFSGLFGFSSVMFNRWPPNASEAIPGAWVTGGYYETLGLDPIAGRLLTNDDDRLGAPAAAVITDGYWERKFGRDPKAIGRTIRIEGIPVTIVGVSPPGFTGIDVAQNSDVTLAAGTEPQFEQGRKWNIGPGYFTRLIFAQPRAGIPLAQVKARLVALWPEVATLDPNASFKAELALPPDLIPGGTGSTALRSKFRRPLSVLMALVGLVLLIACANVANLLLARASARQREIAVRLAIGAGRGRIIRQLLTESALLAACGAALGIAFAWFGSSFIVELFANGQNRPVTLDVAPHGHVLMFTALVAVATAMLFGIAPAFRATSAGPAAALKDTAVQVAGSRTKLALALVVLQVSLSLLLLVGAGLFVGTLRNLRHLDAGFRHEGVLIVELDGSGTNRQALLDRMRRLPGVVSVSFSNNTVLSGGSINNVASLPGGAPVTVDSDWIGPRYFETLRTPMIEGREFTIHDDRTSPRVAIVNQAFVRHFFPDGHALGQHFLTDLPPVDTQIVGVVEDARSHSLRDQALPAVYVPSFESGGLGNFEVRAKGSIAQVVSELRRELHAAEIYPLTQQVEKTLVQERLMATLAGSFGVLALTLASIGLYGLLAYAVARRTSEIAIRMALGAERADVLRMVVRDALRLLGLGIALGLPAAWAASRWVSSMLFGLTPTDPITVLAATALLAGFGLLAGFIPALRASRVDPMVALRYE